MPFRAREVTELCVPMFHALGFMQAIVGVGLGSTLVVRRRFDPEVTLDSLEEHHATAMVVVPVMLSRIVDLGEEQDQAARHVGAADHLRQRLGARRGPRASARPTRSDR